MKFSTLIFISFFIAIINCQVFTTFDGLWTDDLENGGYGGNFSICTVGNMVYGLESNFAIIFGSLSEDGLTWSGVFYEPMPQEDFDCGSGTFSFTLIANGTRIEGMYGCENRRLNFNFYSKRINADPQTPQECGQVISLTESNTISGRWISTINGEASKLDLCIDDDHHTFTASYNTNSNLPFGYDEGTIFNTKIATGATYLANVKGYVPGGVLYFLTPTGNLARIYWNGENTLPNINLMNDRSIHGYDIYRFAAGTVSSNCERFSSLANQEIDFEGYTQVEEFEYYYRIYPVFYPNATSYYDVNGAGFVTCSLMSIIALILLVA